MVLVGATTGSLLLAGGLLSGEILAEERRRAALRRLRYVKNHEVVVLPPPATIIKRSGTHGAGGGRHGPMDETSKAASPVDQLVSSEKSTALEESTSPYRTRSRRKALRPSSSRDKRDEEPLYHLFLSHTWAQGQSDMRVIKERLKEILPSCVTFLDVDDLKKGAGGEFVDASVIILVCCTQRYFQSQACARELLRAVLRGKPLIALIEPEARHGAFTIEEIRETLSDDAWAYSWGLEGEMAALGYDKMPTGQELVDALFADYPIEWNRFSAFQVQQPEDGSVVSGSGVFCRF